MVLIIQRSSSDPLLSPRKHIQTWKRWQSDSIQLNMFSSFLQGHKCLLSLIYCSSELVTELGTCVSSARLLELSWGRLGGREGERLSSTKHWGLAFSCSWERLFEMSSCFDISFCLAIQGFLPLLRHAFADDVYDLRQLTQGPLSSQQNNQKTLYKANACTHALTSLICNAQKHHSLYHSSSGTKIMVLSP